MAHRIAKAYCVALGAVFLVLGLVGSVSGGHAHALGPLGISFYHNVLHLTAGIVTLTAVAAGPRHVRMFGLGSGVVFAVLAVTGRHHVAPLADLLALTAFDTWTYALVATCSWVLGILLPVPLRLRNAVDTDAPVSWA